MKKNFSGKEKSYSEKEVEEILERACSALSDLSVPKLVEPLDKPFFNGRNTHDGWRKYLLTGNIDNEYTKKALEQYGMTEKGEPIVVIDDKGAISEHIRVVSLEGGESSIFDPILGCIEGASKKEYTLTEKESKLRELLEILSTAGGCEMAKLRLENSSFMEKLSFLNDEPEWKEHVVNILSEYAYKLKFAKEIY